RHGRGAALRRPRGRPHRRLRRRDQDPGLNQPRSAAVPRTAAERADGGPPAMREYVWLECTVGGARNYRTQKETRGANRLALKKFCRKERKHTAHKESRKK